MSLTEAEECGSLQKQTLHARFCPKAWPRMSKHIRRQLERLKERILEVGAIAEKAIADAISALPSYDAAAAEKIFSHHIEMDRAVVDLAEQCLQTLALYQPAASDLRLVVAALKINKELELIAELTKNIAKRVLHLIRSDKLPVDIDFAPMANHASAMVRSCLDALAGENGALAHQVRRDDGVLDAMRRAIHQQIRDVIRQDPQQAEPLLKLYSIAKHLERIGGMATNIAADVICMTNGRHDPEEDEGEPEDG